MVSFLGSEMIGFLIWIEIQYIQWEKACYDVWFLKYRQMIGLIQFLFLLFPRNSTTRLASVQITSSAIKRNFWSVIFKNYFRFVGKRKSVLLASLDCTS